jgi:serine/threonine protein kinase
MSRSPSPPPAHHISRADVEFDETKPLGQGGFGAVFKGARRGGSIVAVKRLLQGLTARSRLAFQREVAIMCSMSCEFVVQVYGVVDDSPDQPVLLVMECMEESLYAACNAVPSPSLRQRVTWLVQAAKGILFLHTAGVIHRDIKPSNMLISPSHKGSHLKIGDFGLSTHLSDITSASMRGAAADPSSASPTAAGGAGIGTPHYMAPEIIDVDPAYSPASDVYAFAVVVWETICLQRPFADCPDVLLLKKAIQEGMRETFPDNFPPAIRAVIERAWQQDPALRPPIVDVLRELERLLGQLAHDAPDSAYRDSRCSSLAAPDSRVAPDSRAAYDSTVPSSATLPSAAPPLYNSTDVDLQQLSALTVVDIPVQQT